MSRTATLRSITGDIDEIALFAALRAGIRRSGGGDGITALFAFPVSQVTLGAYIPYEPSVCSIAAVRTNILFSFFFHFSIPFNFLIQCTPLEYLLQNIAGTGQQHHYNCVNADRYASEMKNYPIHPVLEEKAHHRRKKSSPFRPIINTPATIMA